MGKESDQLQNFIKEHWFKIGVLAVGLFVAWIAYDALIAQPREVHKAEEIRIAAELEKEEERKENLEVCLEESEYERTTAHIALCADPNIGRALVSCGAVFGGASNYSDIMDNYEKEFPGELPSLEEYITENLSDDFSAEKVVEGFFAARSEITTPFFEACNCGLEKYRRDDLDAQREKRDKICLQKYSD